MSAPLREHDSVRTQQAAESADSTVNVEDLEAAIDRLEGKDKIGTVGEIIGSIGGVGAGAATAGALAGALGATTFLGSTTLGSLVGGFLVTTTPVGWVIGCAVVGGAAAYGVTRLVRSGGQQDAVRATLKKRLRKRLDNLRNKGKDEAALRQLREVMAEALDKHVLDDAQVARTLALIESGSLSVSIALDRIRAMLDVPLRGDVLEVNK